MKSNEELQKEYFEFQVKVNKAGKDFCDAVNGLSPENYKRFKKEMLTILPEGLINLINTLNN